MKKLRKNKDTLSVYASCACECSCSCVSCATSSVPNDDILKLQLRKSNTTIVNQKTGNINSQKWG